MRRGVMALAAAGMLLLSGCGGTASADRTMNAGEVVQALKKSGLPIGEVIVFTAQTDPNGQMGKPGGYTSKAACVDTRVPPDVVRDKEPGGVEPGCGVEVFPTMAAASSRGQHIQQQLQGTLGGLLGREHHYVRGGVLLRVTGHLTPAQAEEYKTALAKLP